VVRWPSADTAATAAGAPSRVNAESDKRFEALRTHADLLAKVPRIVLAGDNDIPGLALREELEHKPTAPIRNVFSRRGAV
jgi:hypothetical protein